MSCQLDHHHEVENMLEWEALLLGQVAFGPRSCPKLTGFVEAATAQLQLGVMWLREGSRARDTACSAHAL